MGAERVGMGEIYGLDLNLEKLRIDGGGTVRQNEKCREALWVLAAEVIIPEEEGEMWRLSWKRWIRPAP